MLTEVELKNYRGHTDTRVPLARFTLLVGDNAVGKTSVLEAVSLVARSVTEGPNLLFTGDTAPEFVRRHNAAVATTLLVRGASQSSPNASWSLAIQIPLETRILDVIGYAYADGQDQIESRGRAFLNAPGGITALLSNVSLLPPPTILRLEPRRLAEPSTSDDLVPSLASNGAGLATVLKHLKATDDERYRSLEGALRAIVPSLSSLNFRRVQRPTVTSRVMTVDGQQVIVPEQANVICDELLLKFTDTDWLPAHSASEGTLLTLGVLTRLYEPSAPRVLLLDDIDRALHPRAQGEFIARLRAALEALPDAQIIATAHSPYIADHFEPDAVVVLGRPDDGPVVARRLSEHPDQKLRDALTTGEFLTASGAGWFW
ncbi:MAG: hypothetical protein JWM10_2396 [Myxococcaceae bacterium]|nr:hypothetical protein [Myxococcaceae bacterium]